MSVIPEIFPDVDRDTRVMKLKKCLYGMAHSGRQFSRVVEEHMHELGFTQLSADRCVYIKTDGTTGKVIIVAGYVDDFLVLTNDSKLKG